MGMGHARTTQASHEYPSIDFRMRKEIVRIRKENSAGHGRRLVIAIIITLDHVDVWALILVHSAVDSAASFHWSDTTLACYQWSLSWGRQSISRAQNSIMITIVLMFTISWPGNGELGTLSALCLHYNFSVSWFKSVPVPRQRKQGAGAGWLWKCGTEHCVSIRGQTLLFQIVTYCCGKMALSPALKTIIILNYKKNKANRRKINTANITNQDNNILQIDYSYLQ